MCHTTIVRRPTQAHVDNRTLLKHRKHGRLLLGCLAPMPRRGHQIQTWTHLHTTYRAESETVDVCCIGVAYSSRPNSFSAYANTVERGWSSPRRWTRTWHGTIRMKVFYDIYATQRAHVTPAAQCSWKPVCARSQPCFVQHNQPASSVVVPGIVMICVGCVNHGVLQSVQMELR